MKTAFFPVPPTTSVTQPNTTPYHSMQQWAHHNDAVVPPFPILPLKTLSYPPFNLTSNLLTPTCRETLVAPFSLNLLLNSSMTLTYFLDQSLARNTQKTSSKQPNPYSTSASTPPRLDTSRSLGLPQHHLAHLTSLSPPHLNPYMPLTLQIK